MKLEYAIVDLLCFRSVVLGFDGFHWSIEIQPAPAPAPAPDVGDRKDLAEPKNRQKAKFPLLTS
jgi:hypothetical protein